MTGDAVHGNAGDGTSATAAVRGPGWLAELASPSGQARQSVLVDAIGGRRGLIDSGLPPLVFVVAFLASGRDVRTAVIAALVAGGLVAVLRIVRRQSLQQVLGGFIGVAVSAYVSSRTGRAEDFFLPGLLINGGYATALLISVVVGHPAIGHLVALMGGPQDWRSQPALRRRFTLATWMWIGVFGARLVVQVPLYLLGAVAALGVARVVLGLPLYLAAVWLTWRVAKPAMRARTSADPAQP